MNRNNNLLQAVGGHLQDPLAIQWKDLRFRSEPEPRATTRYEGYIMSD